VKTCTMMKKKKELNKNIRRKSLHHFVQRLLMPSVRQQVAKPQFLMRSQQNYSKQEEKQYWIECRECVPIWKTGESQTARAEHRKVHFAKISTTDFLPRDVMQV